MLRGLQPDNLLDIGSGRGAFLWPLLAEFPNLPVTIAEIGGQRSSDAAAVRKGGIERLTVAQADVHRLPFAPRSFDAVTMLEVLEHLAEPQAALREVLHASRRFVLLSVPSTPDENPQHIHLFSKQRLEDMAMEAGAIRVTFEHVLNHRIMLAQTR
jgi:ubiquinone/menaquinone biosynthesis C-methylase UbiE